MKSCPVCRRPLLVVVVFVAVVVVVAVAVAAAAAGSLSRNCRQSCCRCRCSDGDGRVDGCRGRGGGFVSFHSQLGGVQALRTDFCQDSYKPSWLSCDSRSTIRRSDHVTTSSTLTFFALRYGARAKAVIISSPAVPRVLSFIALQEVGVKLRTCMAPHDAAAFGRRRNPTQAVGSCASLGTRVFRQPFC